MQTVIIVIHLMIVIAMIAVILLQRSEGGALGIGGGGGGGGAGGMFTARGSANLLTRTTTILAITFFVTSLALGILAKQQQGAPSILDGTADTPAGQTAPAIGPGLDPGETLLDALGGGADEPQAPSPPVDDGPATAPAPAVPTVPGTPGTPQIPTGQ
jgi:preprotein translocase subunit SecG